MNDEFHGLIVLVSMVAAFILTWVFMDYLFDLLMAESGLQECLVHGNQSVHILWQKECK